MIATGSQFDAIVPTPLPGQLRIGVVTRGDALVRLEYLPSRIPTHVAGPGPATAVCRYLQAYFDRDWENCTASVSLCLEGTPFQRRVWSCLQSIDVGQTRSYGEIAAGIGSGAQAVAGACRANAVPLLVPCHRVIAADGPGGYLGHTGGAALSLKQWLLEHEQAA